MMTAFLASYRPLISSRLGRRAIQQFGAPPYVDGSCRREPDLQSAFPSISALCRGALFAPRLHPGDVVAYVTKKGRYGKAKERHWRLVAVVEVQRRFESHIDAACWYSEQGRAVPSNCIAPGNDPLPLDQTAGPTPQRAFGELADPARVVRRWDAAYRSRAERCGVFLATRPVMIDLHDPVAIFETDLGIFGGRMPGTQNPGGIPVRALESLLELREHKRAA